MKNYSEKYSMLRCLFAAYFNQDWDCDYNSPEAVISGFAQDGDKQGIKDAIVELKKLIKEEHTKEEWLSIIYDDFGCFCNPEYDGMHPNEWLQKVRVVLKPSEKTSTGYKILTAHPINKLKKL